MAAAAARSVLRSSSLRTAASRVASGARASSRPPILRVRPAAPRFLRSPVEMSFAVESLLPKHSATASALMTSMLTVSLKGYGWLSEGQDETR
ncbi:protein NUCLEAR FUSION DEFECTIVE 6, mitochondrial-like isoform X2 [Phoenix dactylifera]|uniref:Protein NUCLEAR FUSION DEFECTIVE 6, mitochondrial-like isoform X2 n=1 Tax=Phoenix dactylifera TaxID=42345 RepID=A0A8B7CFJ5_PHODC|nr:protein NUCLEAR FUSION DEFECTIVE 6, mitochondrial-like isoform X2 [Phoenix dactylifera]XP_008798257.2 protein NUCLEAR FUSION DEFECTIVE 6, mitochondrial-like isoform X2 [Phoenix dactylifera]XP_008798258.2 protein NUCLEAR FUSION DEFECTIVE 6, mitochondrial-like isoform X2 [Phoenix dactylifera]XP_038987535.1 protein NUCLEAR FUSION DEFECTIVE 6, mitochondrial-like isoform X2 [Phoenix dactylifera]